MVIGFFEIGISFFLISVCFLEIRGDVVGGEYLVFIEVIGKEEEGLEL